MKKYFLSVAIVMTLSGCNSVTTFVKSAETALTELSSTMEKKSLNVNDKSGADYFNLAGVHIRNKEYVKAEPLFEKSCNLNYTKACNYLGEMYHQSASKPSGIKKNINKTVQLYKKSCDLNDASGCLRYASLLEDGIGVAKNKSMANNYLKKSCDLGNQPSCKIISSRKSSSSVTGMLGDVFMGRRKVSDENLGEIMDNKWRY